MGLAINEHSDDDDLSGRTIAGIVIGIIVGIVLSHLTSCCGTVFHQRQTVKYRKTSLNRVSHFIS